MKKFFFILSVSFIMFTCFYMNFVNSYLLNFKYFDFNLSYFNNYGFTFVNDKNSLIFMFMVCLVTCLVCLYSEIYMEHYNNKKFFFLMFLFFLFMSILSMGGSFILFMLGWDGLGLSSICLIMFYPNKTTLYNSVLTMFFNRLGDVILIFVLCKFLMNFSLILSISFAFSLTTSILLMVCGFTKSAQFPLSSWLPAAMSAPTPISAMVHSSTLVTAGILLSHLFMSYFLLNGVMNFMMFFCLLTFLLGGLMGFMELDQKKIIAFSTMSQISMILLFCTLNYISISLSHMVFHAFFKTFLFVSTGMFFLFFFSKQMKNFLGSSSPNFFLVNVLLMLSVYSMSGLIFSSSFFSKDLFLEISCSENTGYIFLMVLMGSIFTILYSSKLMQSIHSFLGANKIFTEKSFYFFFLFIFLTFVNYSGNAYKSLFFLESYPNVLMTDLILILFVILGGLIFFVKTTSTSVTTSLVYTTSLEVHMMKFFSYEVLGKLMNLDETKMLTVSDSMMFKKSYLNYFNGLLKLMNFNSMIYMMLLLIFLMMLTM